MYVTTYYDNVKPCRRVGRLPTAGRGGYHPQVASSDWPILVDGHGRMVGEARPRGSVGSICPATKNAPPKGHRMPAKLPRTANRLLRSPRRQTKLSSGKPPSLPEGLTATGRQAQFLPLTEKHTFANAPTFRDTVPAVPLLTQLSCAFGRIGNRIKPYSVSLPLLISSTTVPPDGVDEEVPHLDCSYCAP